MPMHEGEADGLLGPHKTRFGSAIRSAWGVLGRYRRDLAIISRRSRASIVRDFMLDNAMREFYGIPGVAVVVRGGRFFVVFGGRLFVQLKKLNRRGRPSNFLTPQAQGIIDQAQGELFPELRDVTFATAGYKLNKLETQIEEVTIACHEGESQLWVVDIPESPTGDQQAPVSSITPPPPPLSRIVRREAAPGAEQARTPDGASS